MTIDAVTMQWIVALIIGSIAGLSALVIWIVKLSIELTSMKKDIQRLEDEYTEQKAWNQKQHEELYESRNETGKILERMTANFENMDKKLDQLLSRGA
jgi:uncharacterized membrane-anchored protein YhcB (DUF1043 family)